MVLNKEWKNYLESFSPECYLHCILVDGYGSKNLVSGDYVKYKIDDFKMEKVIIDQTILSNYSGIPLRIQPLR